MDLPHCDIIKLKFQKMKKLLLLFFLLYHGRIRMHKLQLTP